MSLPPLLVTGLPSSGGAVVAEALLRSGCQLGGPFLPLPPRDATGGYVDREIHRWHARALAADEGDACDPGVPPRDALPERLAELDALLDARFDRSRPWALRSSRLLWARQLWETHVTAPRWLIVVRRPAVQAWSRVDHRQESDGQPTGDLRAVGRALRRWREGSQAALALARTHPDRVAILDAAQLAGSDGAADRLLRERWQLPLAPLALSAALRPFLLRRRAPAWVELLVACDPRAAAIWRALQRLTPAAGAGGRRGTVRICVVAKHRFAPSESFIQEQLRRLPGEVHYAFRRGKVWHDRDCLPLIGAMARLRLTFGVGDEARRKAAQEAALARFLAHRRVDVLLANFGPLAVEALPGCRAAGVPLVAHFHGADAHRELPGLDSATLYAEIFRDAAAFVAVSRPMVERLVQLGAPRERILLNPCGVDLGDFPPGDAAAAAPRFLAAGRFVGKKGPLHTLLAFRRLLDRVPEARLTMLGEGELREACVQLASALGMAPQVDFPGAYAHGELAPRLRQVRAFVQHSLRHRNGDSEGTPVALLEAAASALPVVSTRHAGIPQAVVDGETGLLCDEGDVEGMAAAMYELATDRALAGAMGRRAREHVGAQYALARQIGRLGVLLERVARGDSPVVDDAAAARESFGEQAATLSSGREETLAQ